MIIPTVSEPVTPAVTARRKARLLLLGGGPVVAEYHIPALQALGLAPEALITDFSAASLAAISARFPSIATEQGDYKEILNRADVADRFDAVLVALPNWLHEEACSLALKRGLHVLCEKPLSLDPAACERLARQSEQANKILGVAMVRRLLPSIGALRAALERGLIGPVSGVVLEDGSAYSWLSDSGSFFRPENGGVLADMGVHYLDQLTWLFGPLTPVTYRDDFEGGVEANVHYELRTATGVPVQLRLSRTHSLSNRFVCRGARGTLSAEKNTVDRCFWLAEGTDLAGELKCEKPFAHGPWDHTFESCFHEQLARFIDAFGGRQAVDVTAAEAGSVVGLIDWAYKHREKLQRKINAPTRPELSKGPACLTGATGFIGTRLVARLFELGFDSVTCPVRSYRNCSPIARFPVKLPKVDLLDPAAVNEAVRGARYVFHLAYGREGDRAAQITIEGTKNVVEAAISAGAESVVVLSTMFVWGDAPRGTLVDESAPYAPRGGEYGASKAEMERWCLDRDRTSGKTRIVVLNPSCVYGPGGKTYTLLPVTLAKDKAFCWIDDGAGMANYIFVDNLTDAILLAAPSERARGQRFILNDGAITWREFLGPVISTVNADLPACSVQQLKALNRQPVLPSLSQLARAFAKNGEVRSVIRNTRAFQAARPFVHRLAPRLFSGAQGQSSNGQAARADKPPSVAPVWLADLFGPTRAVFSAEKARRVLGWTPLIDLRRGQQISLEWLKETNVISDAA